jgi:hypothetical protein
MHRIDGQRVEWSAQGGRGLAEHHLQSVSRLDSLQCPLLHTLHLARYSSAPLRRRI